MVSEHASPLAVVGGVDAGGQNVHVAALSVALADRGHEVVVYTRRDGPGLPDRVRMAAGVTVEHLDAGPAVAIPKDELLPLVPELAGSLARRLAADPPDVLHAHFWMSGMACAEALRRAAPLTSIPFVQTFHALGTVKRRWLGAQDTSPAERVAVEARLAGRADLVVATCSDEVGELVAAGADPAKVDVVPCGVDVDHFTPEGPVAPRARGPRLLALGRLVRRKGVDDAVAALARLPRAELVVAGGPSAEDLAADPEAQRLRALAAQLGVRSRVHLVGRVPRAELPLLIRSADAVLCLPWYEPFGIVPLEAMACGVPVVGTAVGGLLDTVVEDVTGTLLPVRRPDLVAGAVAGLLADEPRRAAYGMAGVRRAREHYGWPRVAEATEACYERVTATVSTRTPPRAPTSTATTSRTSRTTGAPTSPPSRTRAQEALR
jgi:D-inositol-3-phosphate glycosyltransferase